MIDDILQRLSDVDKHVRRDAVRIATDDGKRTFGGYGA
jgi:hypothetical protein